MTIKYNLTGSDRKALVEAISQELNTSSKYLGAPTFAYQVGEYTIDKNGTLTGADNWEMVADLQGLHSLTPASTEYDTPADEEYPDIDQHHPGQYTISPPDDEMIRHARLWMEGMPEYTEEQRLIIEMPKDRFTPDKLENLCRLVAAKEALIKTALGTDEVLIQQSGETIMFPWFCEENKLTAEEIDAYAKFISLLCETAKAKTRITAKEKPISGSPKYAMRCFLLSIGMIGTEYKSARKILLSKLEGNSSWKNGIPVKDEAEAETE